jgi:hypothetical protein
MYREFMENRIENIAFNAPNIQVAKNVCYELSYNETKNRIYFKICGFWKNKECVSEFLNDWDRALELTQPGFTVLTDMRTMITHPQSLKSLHVEAQHKVKAAGVLHVAHIMSEDKIANLQIEAIADTTHLPSRNFDSLQEAEQWLDGGIVAYP